MSRMHSTLATIPNRYAFINTIDASANQCHSLSLMLIDVVRFSDVTTSLGITVGDRFLLEIANRLHVLFNKEVRIGRISGDVFGVVFLNTSNATFLRDMFERLVEHFKTPMYHDEHAFIADFNVGVVQGRCDEFEITAFVSRAEAALKQAKENNTSMPFNPQIIDYWNRAN